MAGEAAIVDSIAVRATAEFSQLRSGAAEAVGTLRELRATLGDLREAAGSIGGALGSLTAAQVASSASSKQAAVSQADLAEVGRRLVSVEEAVTQATQQHAEAARIQADAVQQAIEASRQAAAAYKEEENAARAASEAASHPMLKGGGRMRGAAAHAGEGFWSEFTSGIGYMVGPWAAGYEAVSLFNQGISALTTGMQQGVGTITKASHAGLELASVFQGDRAAIDSMLTSSQQLANSSPVFSEQQIAQAEATERLLGLNANQIRRLTPELMDMATVMGTDVTQAAQRVGLALEGNMRALKQLGISVKADTDPMAVLNDIEAKAAEFHQAAAHATQTEAGQMAELTKQTDEANAALARATLGLQKWLTEVANAGKMDTAGILNTLGHLPEAAALAGKHILQHPLQAFGMFFSGQAPEMATKWAITHPPHAIEGAVARGAHAGIVPGAHALHTHPQNASYEAHLAQEAHKAATAQERLAKAGDTLYQQSLAAGNKINSEWSKEHVAQARKDIEAAQYSGALAGGGLKGNQAELAALGTYYTQMKREGGQDAAGLATIARQGAELRKEIALEEADQLRQIDRQMWDKRVSIATDAASQLTSLASDAITKGTITAPQASSSLFSMASMLGGGIASMMGLGPLGGLISGGISDIGSIVTGFITAGQQQQNAADLIQSAGNTMTLAAAQQQQAAQTNVAAALASSTRGVAEANDMVTKAAMQLYALKNPGDKIAYAEAMKAYATNLGAPNGQGNMSAWQKADPSLAAFVAAHGGQAYSSGMSTQSLGGYSTQSLGSAFSSAWNWFAGPNSLIGKAFTPHASASTITLGPNGQLPPGVSLSPSQQLAIANGPQDNLALLGAPTSAAQLPGIGIGIGGQGAGGEAAPSGTLPGLPPSGSPPPVVPAVPASSGSSSMAQENSDNLDKIASLMETLTGLNETIAQLQAEGNSTLQDIRTVGLPLQNLTSFGPAGFFFRASNVTTHDAPGSSLTGSAARR